MTSEELLEEIRKLREEIGGLREELRSYIRKNENNNEIISNASEQEIDSAIDNVVYGSVQANPNEPKDIVLSDIPNVDDRIINQTDEDRYYKEQDSKIVNEFLEKNKEVKVENQEERVEKEDRSRYIPGTDILKPRDRYINETDEDYIKFLKEYYAEKFPKGLAVVNNAEKGLAILDDVKKPSVINDIENELNNPKKTIEDLYEDIDALQKGNISEVNREDINKEEGSESLDIFSNSDGTSASIAPEIAEEKKKQEEKRKSEVIKFDSEEEKEAFEKSQNTDYTMDEGSKTKKVGKIRKSIGKFKDVLKKHGKKIIAGVLVAATAIGAALAAKSCAYDKKDDLSENKDNTKSSTDEFNSTIPSVAVANSFGAKYEDVFGSKSTKDEAVKSDDIISKISEDNLDMKQDKNYNTANDTYDVNSFDIGDTVKFNGDYIYKTATDAVNDTNRYEPYYSNDDEREISAIEYVSPDGTQHMTAVTEKEQSQLESMGWKEESVNMKNNTRSNDTYDLKYEGWTNLDDVSKVK